MNSDTRVSKKALWTGRILSALPVPLFLMSAGMKLAKADDVIKGMDHLGYPGALILPLGILELTCTILYAIPQTAVLGAILLTGYLGGAIATHVRLGEPFVMHIVIGIVLWLGIFLRDPRLRALLPLRS